MNPNVSDVLSWAEWAGNLEEDLANWRIRIDEGTSATEQNITLNLLAVLAETIGCPKNFLESLKFGSFSIRVLLDYESRLCGLIFFDCFFLKFFCFSQKPFIYLH